MKPKRSISFSFVTTGTRKVKNIFLSHFADVNASFNVDVSKCKLFCRESRVFLLAVTVAHVNSKINLLLFEIVSRMYSLSRVDCSFLIFVCSAMKLKCNFRDLVL